MQKIHKRCKLHEEEALVGVNLFLGLTQLQCIRDLALDILDFRGLEHVTFK